MEVSSEEETDVEVHTSKRKSWRRIKNLDSEEDATGDEGGDEDKENDENKGREGAEELAKNNEVVAAAATTTDVEVIKVPTAAGTFAEEGDMDDDYDDHLLTQAAEDLEKSFLSDRQQKQVNELSGSSTEGEDDDNVGVGGPRRSRIVTSSTEDEDEYDKDDDFVDDSDVEDSSDISDEQEVDSDFERLRSHVNSFEAPDPYRASLRGEKKAKTSGKRKNEPRPKKKKRRLFLNNSDIEEEEEQSSDPEDYMDNVQEVSIHQIKINHHAFDKFRGQADPEEKIIEAIIKNQNEIHKKKNAPEYKEKVVVYFPKMPKEDLNLFKEGDGLENWAFKIKIYAQVIFRRPALMTAYGVEDVTSQVCHTLTFHYRKGEIFALTTNQAWNVVQWCSDFGFPGKVAARILTREGALEVTKKGLIGTDFMSKRTHNQLQESNPFDLLTFCTGYTTTIDKKASILKLECFENQRPDLVVLPEPQELATGDQMDTDVLVREESPSTSTSSILKTPPPAAKTPTKRKRTPASKLGPRPTTKVVVSQAAIRFLKRFRASDFLSILNHLSLIARSQQTQTMDGEVEEDSSAHVTYLNPVHIEVARKLDVELASQVHSAIADHRYMNRLENYDFAHKHFMDFFYGHDFFLKYGQNNQKHWKHAPPTLSQVIQALRGVDKLVEVAAGTQEKEFKKLLDKCQINYLTHDGKQTQKGEKVLNFIQGMFYRPADNNVYWHIKGLWCHLHPSYILLVQKELLALIEQHLRDPVTLGLKFPWTPSQAVDEDDVQDDLDENAVNNFIPNPYEAIQDYLDQYRGQPNFFVAELPGSDIVDMIKISETSTTETEMSMNRTTTAQRERSTNCFILYYLIPSLSHKVISQGIRVTKCLTGLRKGESADLSAGVGTGAPATGTSSRRQKRIGVGGSEHNLEELQKLYGQVRKQPEFLRVAPNFETFKSLLSNARVVMGIGKESDAPLRTLEEERVVPISIEPNHIQDQLMQVVDRDPSLQITLTRMAAKFGLDTTAPNNFANLSMEIHRLMITNELIGTDNSITSKLVALSPTSVPIPALKEFAPFLNEHVIKAFQPPASTFLGKMELIRIRRHTMNLGMLGQFFIAEIPLAD